MSGLVYGQRICCTARVQTLQPYLSAILTLTLTLTLIQMLILTLTLGFPIGQHRCKVGTAVLKCTVELFV